MTDSIGSWWYGHSSCILVCYPSFSFRSVKRIKCVWIFKDRKYPELIIDRSVLDVLKHKERTLIYESAEKVMDKSITVGGCLWILSRSGY